MTLTLAAPTEPNYALAIDETCRRIPPFWPLQNFVAVNPFLGLSEMPFKQAASLLARVAHGTILMDSPYYLGCLRQGSISPSNIRAALSECACVAEPADPVSWLEEQLKVPVQTERILSVAEWLDHSGGTSWAQFVVDEISKWCSSYFDQGQSPWAMPWKNLPLYQAWKRSAEIDANPEVFGLSDFRRQVKDLPQSENDAIEYALGLLDIPQETVTDFLHRQMMTVSGWSAYAAYQDRQGFGDGTLRQLLAIRLAYDVALLSLCKDLRLEISHSTIGSAEAKYIAHLALEHAYRSTLITGLEGTGFQEPSSARKSLQAVFCIDVRSEVYRRALEAQSDGIETLGFAGFFGMPIEVASTARCPVLLTPGYRVGLVGTTSPLGHLGKRTAEIWKQLLGSASACFSSVELGGIWFGFDMLKRLNKLRNKKAPQENLQWAIPLPERVQLAAGALKNMSIDASRLAPVVLLCGHGSATENNPYGSSLDCGACGGHRGDINARFAAALLNDPEVRDGLRDVEIPIPQDTVFIGALHNTTTDDVVLYDNERLLSDEQRAEIEGWLQTASLAARRERSGGSPLLGDRQLEREAHQRSTDWSEIRPEWGLAGNAAFIAAPRSRTRGLNLEGRVFLHEYDSLADHDGSVLNLILNAPVIVASWINLQYFGSTVNNRVFGSGNKLLHNVVGKFGVWEGNGGDLRTGLPLQSLHDATRWIHQPLRLNVIVEASRERIDQILRVSPAIQNLVENRWIYLLSLDNDNFYECCGAEKWLSVRREC
jgi:uncharacterized protein YbcC (UPF0753/DUF2309 family)